jgi:hypothetical protein
MHVGNSQSGVHFGSHEKCPSVTDIGRTQARAQRRIGTCFLNRPFTARSNPEVQIRAMDDVCFKSESERLRDRAKRYRELAVTASRSSVEVGFTGAE